MADAFARMPGFGAQLIDPKFCCCAIPLVNAGIYTVLAEMTALGLGVGVLAVATPDVVGASFPTFAKYIFAITCFLVALCQPVGFVGIYREKTTTFKWYTVFNFFAHAAAFSTAAALIIVSATSHTKAMDQCETNFFSASSSSSSVANSTLSGQSETLCNAFAWADVGIMGGLWVLLFLVQAYFLYITRSYSTAQVSDHKLYHSVYSENPEAFTMSILRSSRYNPGSVYNNMPLPRDNKPEDNTWDARPSTDSFADASAPGPSAGGYYDEQAAYAAGHRRMYSDSPLKHSQSQYDDAFEGGEGNQAGQGSYGHGQYDASAPAGASYPPAAPQGRPTSQYGGLYPQRQSQNYDQGPAPSYTSGGYPFAAPGGGYVEHPGEAASRDPGPTPTVNDYYSSSGQAGAYAGDGGLRRPDEVQSHPAEGMMGRKSPRR